MTSNPSSNPHLHIFLSYGHDEHADLAVRLKEDLTARGHEVWFDLDRIKPGTDWERYIEDGLSWASKDKNGRVILVMTPYSVRRPDGFCLNELARAILKNIKIIPIMLVWCEPPLNICRIQWLDMTDCLPVEDRRDRYQARFERLIEALQHDRIDFEGYQSQLSTILKPLSFHGEIKYNLERFTGRTWVFDELDRWLSDNNASKVFWIMGGPGVGKTAIASWLCAHRPEIAAFHLCRYDDVQKRDPRRAVTSIAYQLSTQLPDYEERLHRVNMDDLSSLDARVLFDQLIVQPFNANYPDPERDIVVLIDALDEATVEGKNELADLLSASFQRTPVWLRLIITSRPSPEVMVPLQAYSPLKIDITDPRNNEDVRAYLMRELSQAKGDVKPQQIEGIVRKSSGLFLYAEWIVNEIKAGRLSLDKPDTFPQGLAGIYVKIFERQFPDLKRWEKDIAPALEVVCAAQEPLSLDTVASIFKWEGREKRKFRHELSPLFTFDHGIQPFHKSIVDWLTDEIKQDSYYIDVNVGNRLLTEHLWQTYENNAWSPYLVSYLPMHLLKAHRWKDLEALLLDVKFIGAAWETDRVRLISQLVAIDANSALKMATIYGIGFSLEGRDEKGLYAIADLLTLHSNYGDAERILDYLISHYRQTNDSISLAWVLARMIESSNMGNRIEASRIYTGELEDISRKTGNKKMLVKALSMKTWIYFQDMDYNKSLQLASEAEQVSREIGDEAGIANSLRIQGITSSILKKDFDRSLLLWGEEEQIDRERGDIEWLIVCLTNQADALIQKGDPDQAMAKLDEAASICNKIGERNHICIVLENQGEVYEAKGQLDDAMLKYEEGARRAIEINDKPYESANLAGQGRVLYKKNRVDEAISLLKKSIAIAAENGRNDYAQSMLGDLGAFLLSKGDRDEAIEILKRQEKICREKGFQADLHKTRELLTKLGIDTGQ
ncbi:MAG TPA: toll/interleukin-1 receptor domain-containing protein [Methanocella sp.]|nr:toll/interleukin-1 receptor domain-containing protein [Methanocella sp.]